MPLQILPDQDNVEFTLELPEFSIAAAALACDFLFVHIAAPRLLENTITAHVTFTRDLSPIILLEIKVSNKN